MKIKTYRVNNLSEALGKIKRDLGPKAVVLSTQKVLKDGPWYAKSKYMLEVRAALDPSPGILKEREQAISESKLTNQHISELTQDLISPLRAEIQQLKSLIQKQQEQPLEKTAQAHVELEVPIEKKDLVYSLIHHGVNLQAVQQLNQYLLHSDQSDATAEERGAEWIFENLTMADMDQFFNSKMILLLGPTGSGKTTTLAKLAASLKIQYNKKIALINLDQYRVGASEQLEKYAQILQVPFHDAHTQDDLLRLKDELKDFDHILVDTTGRSPYDMEGLGEIAEFFAGFEDEIWSSLTLPITMRETDLQEALNSFKIFNYNNIILTKLDETNTYGNLFNASYFSGKPLSFLTTGQNVPDDIETITLEKVIESLFDFDENLFKEMTSNQEYLQSNFQGGLQL